MGFVTDIVKGIANVVKQVTDFIKAPLDLILKPIKEFVGSILDKLPLGLGKLIKPFVNEFLDNAVGWLAGGPLGGFMSMLNKFKPAAEMLSNIADIADKAVDGGLKNLPEKALENARQAFAYSQAQSLM